MTTIDVKKAFELFHDKTIQQTKNGRALTQPDKGHQLKTHN